MKKCTKTQIYTIHFWHSEKLLETLEKNFAAKRLKMGLSKIDFDPTPYLDLPGGPTVPTYDIHFWSL